MYIYNDKDSLFQWDLNQKVVVENELVKEVHFSNASTTKALIVEVVDGMANIPNILLQNTWDIKAYGYCGECVRETLIINVIARAKPDDYIYTETEIKTYENVIAQVEKNTTDIEMLAIATDSAITGINSEIENIEKQIEKPKFNSVLRHNTWEQIAQAAKLGVAQNYWKVGDYKELTIPNFNLVKMPSFVKSIDEKKFIQKILKDKQGIHYTTTDYTGYPHLQFGASPITKEPYFRRPSMSVCYFGSWEEAGISFYDEYNGLDDFNIYFTYSEVKLPVTIIGFNHDKVVNKTTYGRDKAGITFQLGASRDAYGDKKAAIFNLPIDGIMTADGKHYKSPNKVLKDFTEGATNWADGGFRVALQNILDSSDVADYVITVQKYTSQYFNNTNKYYAPMLTRDKVFLPSEYEIFGLVDKAPGPEGKHYEFYEDGYSKFMWSEELLNGTISGARIWLRSAAAEHTSKDNPNSIYGTSIYLGVYSLDPLNISYMPSGVASGEGVPAYIAPCFCM